MYLPSIVAVIGADDDVGGGVLPVGFTVVPGERVVAPEPISTGCPLNLTLMIPLGATP